jgi:hypothetical protein
VSYDNGEKPSGVALFAANVILLFVGLFILAFGATFLWASVRIVNAIVAVGMH